MTKMFLENEANPNVYTEFDDGFLQTGWKRTLGYVFRLLVRSVDDRWMKE